MKTDQTAQMRRLIWIFSGHTSEGMFSDITRLKCLISDMWHTSFIGGSAIKSQPWQSKTFSISVLLTLVLLNPDIPCLCKQCRSRSVGFWRSQLIWICTVWHSVCEFVSTTWIKQSDWLKSRSGCGILIDSAWRVKGNGYTFKGDNFVKIVYASLWKGF